MPLLSVITAVLNPDPGLIAEAGESIRAIPLPEGWALEWLVQEDGDDPIGAVPSWANHQANGYRLGAGATRNIALVRARGDLTAVLDGDDVLLPAFGHLVATLATRPELGWAAGASDNLYRDGTVRSFEPGLPAGDVPAGGLYDAWKDCGRLVVPSAGPVLYRTLELRRAGGWGALPVSEDTIAVMNVSERTPGHLIHDPVHRYRKHDAQTTASAAFLHFRPRCHSFVHAHIEALRAP